MPRPLSFHDPMEALIIEFLDPRAEASAPVELYTPRIDPHQVPLSIGLLANGFPDSVAFLIQIEEALRRELPDAQFHQYNKGDASIVVPDDMLARISSECQAVVAAYGH